MCPFKIEFPWFEDWLVKEIQEEIIQFGKSKNIDIEFDNKEMIIKIR